jgi:hypothetical protein
VTFELGRSLLQSGTVTPDALARALTATLEPGMPLSRALVGLGLVSEDDLQRELSHSDPNPALAEVHPRVDILSLLPPGMCNRLAALPVHVDADGTVEVAVLDPRDRYIGEELAFHLHRAVRLVRAPYTILREALVNYAAGRPSDVPPPGGRRERRRAVSYTPAWGTPIEMDPPASDAQSARPFSSIPAQPPAVVASVTTSTRRFFAGMHSAPSEPPPVMPAHDPRDPGSPHDDPHAQEPVFELRRGPHMTLTDIDPPTLRIRDAPAFPLVASLPQALPSLTTEGMPEHYPDPASTLGHLRAAADRDEVLGLVEKSARAVAKRVGLMVVRKDGLVGWSCSPEFGDLEAFKKLTISTRTASLLSSVFVGGVYLGPLLGSLGAAFLQVMHSSSRDVALVAVRVKEKPAVLVICDELGDTLLATRHLDVMAKVAGEALERVVRARRSTDQA